MTAPAGGSDEMAPGDWPAYHELIVDRGLRVRRDEPEPLPAARRRADRRGGSAPGPGEVRRRLLPGRICRRVRAQGLHRPADESARLPPQAEIHPRLLLA